MCLPPMKLDFSRASSCMRNGLQRHPRGLAACPRAPVSGQPAFSSAGVRSANAQPVRMGCLPKALGRLQFETGQIRSRSRFGRAVRKRVCLVSGVTRPSWFMYPQPLPLKRRSQIEKSYTRRNGGEGAHLSSRYWGPAGCKLGSWKTRSAVHDRSVFRAGWRDFVLKTSRDRSRFHVNCPSRNTAGHGPRHDVWKDDTKKTL